MDDKILRIKELLKLKGLTYEQFAEMIGKSKPTVVNYFKGASKIDIYTIEKIAKALDVPVGYFFGETNGKNQAVTNNGIVAASSVEVKQIMNHSHELEIENEKLKAELEGCRKLLEEKDKLLAEKDKQIELLYKMVEMKK